MGKTVKTIISWAFTLTIWALLIFLVINIILNIITDIRVNSKIKDPKDCVIINDDYYCKKEL